MVVSPVATSCRSCANKMPRSAASQQASNSALNVARTTRRCWRENEVQHVARTGLREVGAATAFAQE
eukprot:1674927-Alexandrium_andersonii.AAC.1